MAPSASRGSSPLSEVPSSPMEDRAYVEERISDSEYMEDHEDEDIPRPAKASASSPSQLDPVESGDGRFVRGYTENGVVKQFHCAHGTCAKAFSRKSDLIRHVRIHLGQRPFVCTHKGCHKAFIQRSALTVHARTHTGERPHVCDQCTRAFSDSSSLARHRRTHNDEKPYACRIGDCDRSFARKSTLTKHQAREHPGIAPPYEPRRRAPSESLSPQYTFVDDDSSPAYLGRRSQPFRSATTRRPEVEAEEVEIGDDDGEFVPGDDDGFDASHIQRRPIIAPLPRRPAVLAGDRVPEHMHRTVSRPVRPGSPDTGSETEDAVIGTSPVRPFFPRTMSLPASTSYSSLASFPSLGALSPVVPPNAPRIPQGPFPSRQQPFLYPHEMIAESNVRADSPALGHYATSPLSRSYPILPPPVRWAGPGSFSPQLHHMPAYIGPHGHPVPFETDHQPVDLSRYQSSGDIARGLGFRPISPRRPYSPLSTSHTIIRRDSYEVVNTQYAGGLPPYPPHHGYTPYDHTPQTSPPALLGHPTPVSLARQGSSLFGAVLDAQPHASFDRYDSAVHLDGRSSFSSTGSSHF